MPDNAPERFASWLSTDIRPILHERGFTKTGFTFYRRGRAGWGVLNFQKSHFGSRLSTRFAMDLGIALDRLTAAEGADPIKKPSAYGPQWNCRLSARGDGTDQWWTVDLETDLGRLTQEIVPIILDIGLPLLAARDTPSGFLEAMLRPMAIGQIRHEPTALRLLSDAEQSQ
jgi:hypothetical protein